MTLARSAARARIDGDGAQGVVVIARIERVERVYGFLRPE